MTVVVAGMWDLGWNTPIKEIDLWTFPLRDFGVDRHYMVPVSGIQHRVLERGGLQEVLGENPELVVVFCDERADEALSTFVHPRDALYVFGRANFSPFLSLKREYDRSLRIETRGNRGLLWGHQAAAIILHDRLMKCR